MNPWVTALASAAAGKVAGWLSPRQSGAARASTDRAAGRLDDYRSGYDNLYQSGSDTLNRYQPRLDSAVDNYSNYLGGEYGQDQRDQADLAESTSGIQMDSRRLAARVARSLPQDSAASGAVAGAQTSIADRELGALAAERGRIAAARIQRREQAKQAQIKLLVDQVLRGQSQAAGGLAGGAGISSQLLGLYTGRESQAAAQDEQMMGGWQSLAAQIAQAQASQGRPQYDPWSWANRNERTG